MKKILEKKLQSNKNVYSKFLLERSQFRRLFFLGIKNKAWSAISGNRVRKLVSHLTSNGKKETMKVLIRKLKSMLQEYYCNKGVNQAPTILLENTIMRLEPAMEVREFVKRKKGGRHRKPVELVLHICSPRRRLHLGLGFLVQGAKLRCKKTHITLLDSLFREIVCVDRGHKCFANLMKKQHLKVVVDSSPLLPKKKIPAYKKNRIKFISNTGTFGSRVREIDNKPFRLKKKNKEV
jgi:ribosomal protein S7